MNELFYSYVYASGYDFIIYGVDVSIFGVKSLKKIILLLLCQNY